MKTKYRTLTRSGNPGKMKMSWNFRDVLELTLFSVCPGKSNKNTDAEFTLNVNLTSLITFYTNLRRIVKLR
jgi:hypothetical protein